MRDMLSPALLGVRTPLPEAHSGAAQAPGTPPAPRPRGARAPMVERIACWSARHRIAVVVGWLVLAAVTGNTAGGYDFNAALHSRTPLVFAVVAGLALLLLMLAFRSLAIPLISIGLNLLSVGAAYGLVTLIFQDGHLQGPLGFTSFGGIIPWVPLFMFMFVFLFGLSMDYHVFILSRIRELRVRGRTHEEAVVGGVAACSGVVTSAAVIMVAVFSIFATLSLIELKMIGVGLASAVLIDATIVRGILVPAALALLDERSWYFPQWLEWLPGWRLEPSGPPAELVPPSAAAAPVPASVPAVSVLASGPTPQAALPGVPPARGEPGVVLAGERTGSREGTA